MTFDEDPSIWHECTVDEIINLPVSDKYAKTAGLEVTFCPACGHRWFRPLERKDVFGVHYARWECPPCNIHIIRASHSTGVVKRIIPLVVKSIEVTGTWSV